MLAVDLIAWTRKLLLDSDLARAEPKTLRQRLLHVAARITRGQRRTWVRIQQSWPWAHNLAAASLPVLAQDSRPRPDDPARSTRQNSRPDSPACPDTETAATTPERSTTPLVNHQGQDQASPSAL